MKKIFLLVILTITSINIFAQQKSSALNNREPKLFSQPDLDKFYGTWTYEKNGVFFSIILEKFVYINTADNNSMELLKGTHTYKKNGEIIDEKSVHDIITSINVGTVLRTNNNVISFRFNEYKRGVSSNGTMEYVDGATPAIIWKLEPNERRRGIILPGEENLKNPEYIVPTNITLYKLK